MDEKSILKVSLSRTAVYRMTMVSLIKTILINGTDLRLLLANIIRGNTISLITLIRSALLVVYVTSKVTEKRH